MPRTSPAKAFEKLLSGLIAERQACAARLAEIDGMFARYGISLGTPEVKAAGRKAAPKAKAAGGKQRKRRTYKQTSDQFILGLLEGGKTLTTADINHAWKDAGRRGLANNTLTKLTQDKKLVRKDNKSGRGGVYGLP